MEEGILSLIPVVSKGVIMFGLILYTIFSVVVVRQEQLMSRTFEGASEPLIRLLSFVHLVAAVFVLLLGVVLL